MQIAIIGAGNMGQSLAKGLLAQGIVSDTELVLVESDVEKRQVLARTYNCTIISFEQFKNHSPEIIILAVKPQDSQAVFSSLSVASDNCLVISIMAGITFAQIKAGTNDRGIIIRAMPNLAAAIGKSATVYFSEQKLEKVVEEKVVNILGVMGSCFAVPDERLIDVATAIAGSGPAYYFYFTEALINAAKELGFSDSQASLLVLGTFDGANSILQHSENGPAFERARVTSKGGTTEAALAVLEKQDFAKILQAAVRAAFKRAQELADER